MRFDRLLVFALVVICFAATVGNWFLSASFDSRPSVTHPDIALIDVYGGISDGGSGSPFGGQSGSSVNTLIDAIHTAREDEVKVILLRINSPGGTAAASHAVYHELMRTRQETPIKIVASLGDVAASGGYYIASAAHHIVTNPSTLTGSIGVIIRTQNLGPLLNKVGVQSGTVQSGPFKDLLSPYRATTSEEQTLLQGIVEASYQQFLEAIAAGRNRPIAEIKPLADGRIFTGTQAQAAKLADSLGNYRDAILKSQELADIKGEPSIKNYTGGAGSLLNRLLPFSETAPASWDEAAFNLVPLAVLE